MKKLLILLLLVPTLAMSGTFKDDEGKSSLFDVKKIMESILIIPLKFFEKIYFRKH